MFATFVARSRTKELSRRRLASGKDRFMVCESIRKPKISRRCSGTVDHFLSFNTNPRNMRYSLAYSRSAVVLVKVLPVRKMSSR